LPYIQIDKKRKHLQHENKPEDLKELIDLTVSGEERALGDHLREDRAHGPGVHGQRVGLAAQQDLRRAVPQGHHLVRKRADGRHERAGQAEIRELQAAVLGHKDVLRLEVAVHHAAHVAVLQAAQQLDHVGLDQLGGQGALAGLEVLLQVAVDELEHQVQSAFALDNVVEPGEKRTYEKNM